MKTCNPTLTVHFYNSNKTHLRRVNKVTHLPQMWFYEVNIKWQDLRLMILDSFTFCLKNGFFRKKRKTTTEKCFAPKEIFDFVYRKLFDRTYCIIIYIRSWNFFFVNLVLFQNTLHVLRIKQANNRFCFVKYY